MCRAIKCLSISTLLLVWPIAAPGTPSRFTWHREQLIGENADFYFCSVIEHANPGSHYEYIERLSVLKARKSDLQTVEEILVREVHYRDTSAFAQGRWIGVEAIHKPFDLAAYLTDNKVFMAFSRGSGTSLVIDSAGVFLQNQGARARVLSRQELLAQIPELGNNPLVLEEVSVADTPGAITPDLSYYIVQSNHAGYEEDWREDLLVIASNRIKATADEIRQIISPR